MYKGNEKEFSACNIQQWHNLGYTGKGINVGNTEKAYPQSPLFDGKLHDEYEKGYSYSKSANDHGNLTSHVIHQVAPDADIYLLNMGFNQKNSVFSGTLPELTIPMILEKNITVISSSSWSPMSYKKANGMVRHLRDKTVFISAASNDGFEGLDGYGVTEDWHSIGAVGIREVGNEIYIKGYSSRGKELDFVSFSGLCIPHFNNDYTGHTIPEGTSFAAPLFAGMCALVQQFFLEKAGRTLDHFEMEKFIMDNLVDLGDVGWNENYGHGLFVLPDPRDIIVSHYTGSTIEPPKVEEPIIVPPKEGDKMFTDTKEHWAKDYIDFVSNKGLMQGVGDNKFEPNKPMTRAEVATVIARMSGYVEKK